VPLRISNVTANREDGVQITRIFTQDGRVVVVQQAPVLESEADGAQIAVTIYAQPAITYVIESAPSLTAPVQWTEVWRGTVDNFAQSFTFPVGQANLFYRARTP
jgi:hypothetical protein